MKELKLSHGELLQLVEAVSVHLSRKAGYRFAPISRKIDMLTVQFMTVRKLLDIHNEISTFKKGTKMDKEFFKEFQKNVQDKYLHMKYTLEVEELHKAKEEERPRDEKVLGFYTFVQCSGVVDRLVEKENFIESVFDEKIFKKEVFTIMQKEMGFGIAGRSPIGFYSTPSKYIHESKFVKDANVPRAAESIVKMAIVELHLAVAFLKDDRRKEYISALKPNSTLYMNPEQNETITRLHNFNVGRKAIFLQRMNEVFNMLEEFNEAERFGFDSVLHSLVESISFCRKHRINSFLQITNVIMNNLLVEAFKNKNIRNTKEAEMCKMINIAPRYGQNIAVLIKSVGDYIEGYYASKHERLCAYSIDAAMKQALATMCKYDADIFSKTEEEKKDDIK